MKSNIQIRSVPADLHKKLKHKAELTGKTLTDFLLQELKMIAERPTVNEIMDRIAHRKPVRTKMSPTSVYCSRIKFPLGNLRSEIAV